MARPRGKRGDLYRKDSCKKRGMKCNDFTTEECDSIFKKFWASGNSDKQNTFIQALVIMKRKASTRKEIERESRRQNTKLYHLKKAGHCLKVCNTMFLNVLGVTEWKVDASLMLDPTGVGISQEVHKPRNPRPSRGFS